MPNFLTFALLEHRTELTAECPCDARSNAPQGFLVSPLGSLLRIRTPPMEVIFVGAAATGIGGSAEGHFGEIR
jgi:hypothetical protein